jgi:hypothetical protein
MPELLNPLDHLPTHLLLHFVCHEGDTADSFIYELGIVEPLSTGQNRRSVMIRPAAKCQNWRHCAFTVRPMGYGLEKPRAHHMSFNRAADSKSSLFIDHAIMAEWVSV